MNLRKIIYSSITVIGLLLTSCQNEIDLERLPGTYVAVQHCEKSDSLYVISQNTFVLERLGSSNKFRFNMPTPAKLREPGVMYWKGLQAAVQQKGNHYMMNISDRLTKYWHGQYELNFIDEGKVKYLELENDERYLLLEDLNPLLYSSQACRGCQYEPDRCTE